MRNMDMYLNSFSPSSTPYRRSELTAPDQNFTTRLRPAGAGLWRTGQDTKFTKREKGRKFCSFCPQKSQPPQRLAARTLSHSPYSTLPNPQSLSLPLASWCLGGSLRLLYGYQQPSVPGDSLLVLFLTLLARPRLHSQIQNPCPSLFPFPYFGSPYN